MSAAASSLIPPAFDELRNASAIEPAECPGLIECLAAVPDPRSPRGVRHRLVYVLALAAAAVLGGATSPLAIGEWAADAPAGVLAALGGRIDRLTGRCPAPDEATIRRVLARIDADALDRAVGRWLTARRPEPETPRGAGAKRRRRLRAVAVDGKSLRGAALPERLLWRGAAGYRLARSLQARLPLGHLVRRWLRRAPLASGTRTRPTPRSRSRARRALSRCRRSSRSLRRDSRQQT